MGVDLVGSIRSDPAILDLLRQIVSVGSGKPEISFAAIEGQRQFNFGGSSQPQSAASYREITGDNTIIQNYGDEAALNTDTAAFVQISSANADHQYFNSAFTSPASPSASVLFSSPSNESYDFESLLQPPTVNDLLLPTNDTADVQQYFNNDSYASSMEINVCDSDFAAAVNSIVPSATSPIGVVPASPTQLNFDPDFPPLGDDVLEQALKSLGEFTKFAEDTTSTSFSILDSQSTTDAGFDFLQNDDFRDLAWEESFAQIFPSVPNA
jgi:hypothetical protein